jgi:Ca2+-binding RTX toxin-like protein
MANIVIFQPNRYGGGGTSSNAPSWGAQTSTTFEIYYGNGVLGESNIGINFTFASNGFFNSGTITSVYYFRTNGELSSQETNVNIDVATRNNLLTVGESTYNYNQYIYRGNDSFLGSAGDDSFLGSKGSDTINGGAGVDVINFKGFSEGVVVNLSTGQAITSYGTSVISNVEDIEGSAYLDVLTGNSGNNQIQGFGGADLINGGAGFDTAVYFDATFAINVNLSTGVVSGGSGGDSLVSIERVLGSRFNDVLTGSAANESFLGGSGADTINGGGGTDTVEYGFVGSGVVVNLITGLTSGSAGNDVISNVENVKGSIFNDNITGNNGANTLNGDNGNDILRGGGGRDSLNGAGGNDTLTGVGTENGVGSIDTLTGGSGYDRFVLSSATTVFYNDGNNSNAGLSDYALITDFNSSQDKIQLEGSASKYFLGTSPISGVTGTAIYLDTNLNGLFNSTDELVGIVKGSSGLTLGSSYFVYV